MPGQGSELVGDLVKWLTEIRNVITNGHVVAGAHQYLTLESELAKCVSLRSGEPTLLGLLGYDVATVVEQVPIKTFTVTGRADYGLCPTAGAKEFAAIVELKAPGEELGQHAGQLLRYCDGVEAPLGLLFNGTRAQLWVNTKHTKLSRYKAVCGSPVLEADLSGGALGVAKALATLARETLEDDPVATARKLAQAAQRRGPRLQRAREIEERVNAVLNPKLSTELRKELIPVLAGVKPLWQDLKGGSPSVKELGNVRFRPVEPSEEKVSKNSLVRAKVAEACESCGYDAVRNARIGSLRMSTETAGRGYYPVPSARNVPANLAVGGVSAANADKIIVALDELIRKGGHPDG
ncbi:MAG: type I restriction enzyme HsdR N-terminal domain-containing protein [Armatimonadetes bacterium]|nr:type I restriction enzyme HsdR N-terminal domain-containing protein [Armatimonadota bacterium]MDE2206110.1 type I restriction enzyme HsdR N-terminal domain-containing protein [Armatimonadota bacterium]